MTTLASEQIERFLAEDDGAPVVMLNLVRFKPDGGREIYQRYLGLAGPVLARLGAEIIYAGDCLAALAAPDRHQWDAVALVRYPSRQAFRDLIADAEYQKADPLRLEALADAVLQPTRGL